LCSLRVLIPLGDKCNRFEPGNLPFIFSKIGFQRNLALHDETDDMPKRFIGKLPILQKKDIGQDIDIFLLSNRYHFLILHLTKSALNPKFGNALKICQHLHGLAHGHVYIYMYVVGVTTL